MSILGVGSDVVMNLLHVGYRSEAAMIVTSEPLVYSSGLSRVYCPEPGVLVVIGCDNAARGLFGVGFLDDLFSARLGITFFAAAFLRAAHLFRCASAILFRAAALIVRRPRGFLGTA